MVPKIILGKTSAQGLIRYLYGKGRANTHTDPHLVASWNGFAPDPGRNTQHTKARLAGQLDQPVRMLGEQAPQTKVWHCPVRAAPDDRHLSDAEWAEVARRIVHATGIAPDGDPEACRWVAIRHAPDHIHIAATLVRQDGKRPDRGFDRKAAQAEARRIETDYVLRRLQPGDGTAAKRPTSKEHFKATRQSNDATAREVLRTRVRRAVAAAADEDEFFRLLEGTGMAVKPRIAPSGDLLGYSVALPGDTNARGEPVYFSGSTLAGDLSLPRIRERLNTTEDVTTSQPAHRPDAWHQATAALDHIPTALAGDNDTAAQAHLAALGETLDLLPVTASDHLRPQLRQAALDFERGTRSRIRADHTHTQALRQATRNLLRTDPHSDGAALAMLLDAALIAVLAAARWHTDRHHAQQQAAARQTLHRLESAYQQAADPPLTALAERAPAQRTTQRYARHVRETVPDHAEWILTDPAWPALSATLATAEQTGHPPGQLLQQAVGQRPLDDARSPAQVLVWRAHRLTEDPASDPRARAANARSTHAPSPARQPTRPSAAAPGPDPKDNRRRRR